MDFINFNSKQLGYDLYEYKVVMSKCHSNEWKYQIVRLFNINNFPVCGGVALLKTHLFQNDISRALCNKHQYLLYCKNCISRYKMLFKNELILKFHEFD